MRLMCIFAYVRAGKHVMCTCVCASGDHLWLRLQLCDTRTEVQEDSTHTHTRTNTHTFAQSPKTQVSECVCMTPCGVISPQMHDIKTPTSRFFFRRLRFSFFPTRLTFIHVHIFVSGDFGVVLLICGALRDGTEADSKRGGRKL